MFFLITNLNQKMSVLLQVRWKHKPPLFCNEQLQLSWREDKVFFAVGPTLVCGAIQIASVLRLHTLAAEFCVRVREESGSFKALLIAALARLG